MSDIKILFSKESIYFLIVVGLCTAIIGFFVGEHVEMRKYDNYFDSFKPKRILNNDYKLVAPLVGIESNSANTIGRLYGLERDVKKYLKNNNDKVTDFSIYFRDLNSAEWVGFNEDKGFLPASLLKIAVAIKILKQQEDKGNFSNTKKPYTQKLADIEKELPNLAQSELKIGQYYDVDFLLEKMMIDSDNGAKDMLFDMVNKEEFNKLFRLIDVKQPTEVLNYELSSKDYSFFLRMLYSSTYLGAENSQKLLDILTKVKFEHGLVKGLPPHVIVAHKFGTFTGTDKDGNVSFLELHDCGIIYNQKHPYILCVMTKGDDMNKMSDFIAGISKVVYDSAEEHYGDGD